MRGNLDLLNNAQVGANTSMATRVETYVGGNCRYGGGSWATPCTGNQDSRRIYSKKDPPSYIVGVNNVAPLIPEPAADWATWYENSIPGPAQSCTTVSGTPPTFDTNYPNRDNSVSSAFELTPASSYTCRVGPPGSPSGELSWNASTKVLTVAGTIFIDGSAKVTNNALNQYNGQATLYLSGTFVTNNSTKFCGGVSGGNCDFAAWNPNTEMLTIVTNGSGGLAGTGNGFKIDNNSYFQGGALRDVRRRVHEQRSLGRPDRRTSGQVLEQCPERPVPDDHRRAGGHAGQPDRLRAAEPAADVRRLRAAGPSKG